MLARSPDAGPALAAALAGLLVASLVAPAATAATQARPATDNTVTRVEVLDDGRARWTVSVRTRLENDSDVEAFDAFRRELRANRSRFLSPFRRRMSRVVADAANATGREMDAREFRVSASVQEVPRRWGVVTYSFVWTGFAVRRGDALVVGDVFEGGLFLAEGDGLQVLAPEGYVVESVEPAPDRHEDGLVGWLGREDFGDGRPTVRLAPAPATTGATGATGAEAGPPETPGGGGLPVEGVGLLLAGLAVVAAGGAYVRRRSGPGGSPPDGEREAPADDAGAGAEADAEEVVTDGERVRALLAENGGRMRQPAVAEALGWSASKTSRVLSSLAEEGAVEKTRLGRENLVDLADRESGDGENR